MDADRRALGARLREARETRRLTQAQVAEALGLARTTVVAIEKGQRVVGSQELVRLAELYGRPLSRLLRKGPPPPAFTEQLRGHLSAGEADDAAMLAAVEELRTLCDDYRRLEELRDVHPPRRYPPPVAIDDVSAEEAAEEAAGEERRRLGLGDGPLLRLRDLLDDEVGLRVFYLRLPSNVAGLYAYDESLGACIGVDVARPLEDRRRILAHLFGHFLVARLQGEVLHEARYRRVPREEVFASAFARAFLLSPEGLRRRFLDLQRERGGAVSRGDLLRLAWSHGVTVDVVVRRLEDLGLLPAGAWERRDAAGLRVADAHRLIGLEPLAGEEPLPMRYVALAVEAWQEGDLSEGELARLLRSTRLDVRSRLRLDGAAGEAGAPSLAEPFVARGRR